MAVAFSAVAALGAVASTQAETRLLKRLFDKACVRPAYAARPSHQTATLLLAADQTRVAVKPAVAGRDAVSANVVAATRLLSLPDTPVVVKTKAAALMERPQLCDRTHLSSAVGLLTKSPTANQKSDEIFAQA